LPGGFSFDHSKTEDSERQLRSLAGLAHLQLAANVFESLSIRYVPGDKPFVMVNGNPCNTDGQANWPAAIRFAVQLIEEFKKELVACCATRSRPTRMGVFFEPNVGVSFSC
jgi:hypothetical protein